jgi:transcriptional regulator with XRE-family HTH domain
MNQPTELGRRLKFLRERDQFTITKLSQLTHYDKERLRDFEAGRAEPKDWEIQTIAEVFKVKPDYFVSGKAAPEAEEGDVWKVPPVDKRAPASKKARGDLDFAGFDYFKESEKTKATAAAKPAPPAPPKPKAPSREPLAREEPLASDLFDESDAAIPAEPASAASAPLRTAAPPAAAPAARAAAAAQAEAPPPRPPAAPPPPAYNATDARVAAVESLVYLKALVQVLLDRGLFTAEDFARSMRRARGG